jgi:RND superfamily putative drug exporter
VSAERTRRTRAEATRPEGRRRKRRLAGLAVGASLAVLFVMAAAVTLLPALLGLCGDRIERLRIGRDRRPTLGHSVLFERLGRRLARRPGMVAVTSVVALAVLCAPVRSLHLGLTDQSSAPNGTTSRQAYDLLTSAFGPGANGALLVAVDHPSGPDDPRLASLQRQLASRAERRP